MSLTRLAIRILLPIVLLTTCTGDTLVSPGGTVRSQMDVTGLFRAGDEFGIPVDRVDLSLTRVSDNTVAFSRTLTGAEYAASGGNLVITVTLTLDASPEDFTFLATVYSGGVEYYRATGTITAIANQSVTTLPLTPVYTGPGANADLLVIPPSTNIARGQTQTITAVVSQGGTAVTGVPVAFGSSDSSLIIPTSVSFNQADVTAPATGSGSVTITAKTPNGLTASGLVSWPLVTGPPSSVTANSVLSQTTTVNSAVAAPPSVIVRDASGNLLTGVNVVFAVATGGGSLTGPSTIATVAGGVATVGGWTVGPTAGSNTVTATVAGLPAVTFTATGVVSAPAHVTANSSQTQTATVNTTTPTPPSVLVTDASFAPVSGVTVVFAVTSGGGSIAGPTSLTTNASGVVTVTSWTLGQVAGTNTVTATVSGLPPVTFTGTGTAGAPTSMALISGSGQTGPASSVLPLPLVVEPHDAFANPVPGVTVTWATPSGGSLAPPSGLTNASGQAQATWTLGPVATSQTATATVATLPPVTFTATVGLPQITLSFASIPGVGIGLAAAINISLGSPAPAGGLTVSLASGNTSFFTVTPPTVTIGAGLSAGNATINGVAAGTANLTATATGYTTGTLSVTVQNRNISVPPTLNVPYGQTASLPIQLPAPAPAGGVSFTVVSSTPGNVAVASSPVTIAAGGQTANATLNGVLPGPATITVSNPAYLDGITAATTTASLDIVQTSVNPNASFGTPITINFTSSGTPAAAPAPGIIVTLVSRTPACAVAASPVTIATGLVSVGSTVTYGGSAPGLPCTTYVVATAPNLQPDSVFVTVSPLPAITVSPVTVGSGLQVNTSFFLAAGNHGNMNVTVTSGDPAVLVAPDAATPGLNTITIPVADGVQSVGFYVQGKEGRTTDTVLATLTIQAPGFSDGTGTMTAVEGATDLQGVPPTTTTLSPSNTVYLRLGIANAGYTQLNQLQNLRAGAPASVVATFTTPAGGVGRLLKAAAPPGLTQTALIAALQDNTPTDTTSGGVFFQPLTAGTTSVFGSIPGFVPTAGASSTKPIVVSQPTITTSDLTVGSGLQVNNAFFLGASAHGNIAVTVVSSDPAVLVSPNATTPGTDSIDIPVADGVQNVGYYVQGLEGRTTDTVLSTITIRAPGFGNGTGTMTAVEGATDLQGQPGTTTTLTPSNAVYLRLGIANAGYTQLNQLQNLRAGAPASVVATFTTPAGGVGRLLKAATPPGLTQTALIAALQDNTPTDTTSGGVFFQPLTAGTTSVFGSIPGFVPTAGASSTKPVTVSQPTTTINPLTVGSGLQVNSSFFLSASAHGNINVTLTSSDPAILLSPNATTAGADSIDIPVADGVQSVGFYVQGLEGRTTDTVNARVAIKAPGFSPDTVLMTAVQAGFDLQGLPGSTTTLSPTNMVYVRLGIADQTYTQLNQLQNLRFGGPGPVTVTFQTPGNGIGELLKAAVGSSTTQTALIPANGNNTPTDTSTGGVGFHSLLSGTTTVSATAPGYFATAQATRTITSSQPTITTNAVTVGSGLQVNNNFFLGAPNHGAINVSVVSSNPALLISPDAVTPGSDSISIPVADGVQSVGYYVQGLEGQTGSVVATITVKASGFTNGTAAGTVVQGAIDLQGLPGTTTPFTPSNMIYARLGIDDASHTQLNQLQNLRAGGPGAPMATFTISPTNGVGELLKKATPARSHPDRGVHHGGFQYPDRYQYRRRWVPSAVGQWHHDGRGDRPGLHLDGAGHPVDHQCRTDHLGEFGDSGQRAADRHQFLPVRPQSRRNHRDTHRLRSGDSPGPRWRHAGSECDHHSGGRRGPVGDLLRPGPGGPDLRADRQRAGPGPRVCRWQRLDERGPGGARSHRGADHHDGGRGRCQHLRPNRYAAGGERCFGLLAGRQGRPPRRCPDRYRQHEQRECGLAPDLRPAGRSQPNRSDSRGTVQYADLHWSRWCGAARGLGRGQHGVGQHSHVHYHVEHDFHGDGAIAGSAARLRVPGARFMKQST